MGTTAALCTYPAAVPPHDPLHDPLRCPLKPCAGMTHT